MEVTSPDQKEGIGLDPKIKVKIKAFMERRLPFPSPTVQPSVTVKSSPEQNEMHHGGQLKEEDTGLSFHKGPSILVSKTHLT